MRKPTKVKENSPALWRIPPLQPQDNKYTRGHVVILAGAAMTGASQLAALAAQRAGAGMVTLATTPASWPIYAVAMQSVIARPLSAAGWAALVADARVRTILIGPGAGLTARTTTALRAAATAQKPLILDADALTLMAGNAALRKALLPAPKILTPHACEAARLAKALKLPATLSRVDLALRLATELRAIVVLKGAESLITDGKRTLVARPPHWLATAGTGDVLAGIIAALVAQGMPLFEAAAAGVWLHAQAALPHGPGMIAEDVIAGVAEALRATLTKY